MSSQPSRLEIDVTDPRHLRVSGIVDSHTADQMLGAVRHAGLEADTMLDLSGVTFMDSSGLRSIVTAHQEFDEAGTRLLLTATSDSVARLLEITGLTDHLHLT